jgi:opacity protein-like surface antigen
MENPMKRFAFLILFILCAGTPGRLFAQEYPLRTTLGFGGRLGYYKSVEADRGSYDIGAIMRFRISEGLGLEATVDYRGEETFNAGRWEASGADAKVSYVPITVSAMVFLPFGSTLAPYAVGGIGWYHTLVNYELKAENLPDLVDLLANDENRVMGYHFGLGIEVPASDHLAFHVDYRYVFLGTEIKSIRDITTLDVDTKNSDGGSITLGVMLYL